MSNSECFREATDTQYQEHRDCLTLGPQDCSLVREPPGSTDCDNQTAPVRRCVSSDPRPPAICLRQALPGIHRAMRLDDAGWQDKLPRSGTGSRS